MTGQAPDLAGPHEEEQVESDFFGDGNVADESEDHRAQVFRVCACPLASNKVADVWVATQTLVGQVDSEFQGDVTSCQQTSRRLRLGDQRRKGQTMAKNPKVSK